MIRAPQRLPDPQAPWFDRATGKPIREFYQYMRELDQSLRELLTTSNAMTEPVAFADLPTGTEGQVIYVSNGRKNGEGAGLGTGVLAFHDGSAWIAVDTGAAVAA
jgi:hypothetical protein